MISRLAKLAIAGCLPALLLVPSGSIASRLALAPGDAAPALTGGLYPSGERHVVDFSANKLTLVNFWTTWCVPCKAEMPRLQQLHDEHSDEGFAIIGVHEAQVPLRDVDNFIRRLAVTYPILRPDLDVSREWGGIGVWPTSFLVDSEGKILRRYTGAMPEQTEGLVADIEALLDGRPMGPLIMPGPGKDEPKQTHPLLRQGAARP